jgi:hypothetical protein
MVKYVPLLSITHIPSFLMNLKNQNNLKNQSQKNQKIQTVTPNGFVKIMTLLHGVDGIAISELPKNNIQEPVMVMVLTVVVIIVTETVNKLLYVNQPNQILKMFLKLFVMNIVFKTMKMN